ncbi:AAA family ATPase [Vogesella amnigena]|uniref:AAA family ATPase n=1 Tax=Vogesella amnigena TaxID=1507449 RepID=A0ABV7TWK3_9NEIS|nr:AAA family ATPase [Vogesella oryzae]
MDKVASYKHTTSLVTDKKINLIYGLNGAGKSTISNFLYSPDDPEFSSCSKTLTQATPVLVYNQKFIRDNFFVTDNLKGIFSLSKNNTEAEQRIAVETKKQTQLEQTLQCKYNEKEQTNQTLITQKQQATEEVWSIKKTYTGGDRVLEYCLKGLMGKKETLFEHLINITKPALEPTRNIQAIRNDVDALKGDEANSQDLLSDIKFEAHDIESDKLFSTSILGNADSEVAALIEQIGNADWVKQGIEFLTNGVGETGTQCPFCQEATITQKFVESVRSYFDENYQVQLDALTTMQEKYQFAIESLPGVAAFTDHPFAQEHKSSLLSKYHLLVTTMQSNSGKIGEKIKSPKVIVTLADTSSLAEDFNSEIAAINKITNEYNQKLQNREESLENLKEEFWLLMRWQYDQTVSRFEKDQQAANQKLKALNAEIDKTDADLARIKEQIAEIQKQTVNIDEAVDSINAGLVDLGIADFIVKKHSDSLYRVVRTGANNDAFHSLSEGEKMIISFLYFCELCKGKSSIDDTHTQRIVVIDDPISSLSHVFVFNVGRLIRMLFFKDDRFCQVIVLTHSLYFFYELTETNHDRRKETQKLFRLIKRPSGSEIQEMKYEEIQNDYQAYWSVINDNNQPPALIANCMRNIIEYFFNFVRKKDLSNVFQMPELQDAKFQAFCRYINRESHSLGQNIIDMKEFDYKTFKDGLRLIFEKAGYPDHYKAMSKC